MFVDNVDCLKSIAHITVWMFTWKIEQDSGVNDHWGQCLTIVPIPARAIEMAIWWLVGSGSKRKLPIGLEQMALKEKTWTGKGNKSFHSIYLTALALSLFCTKLPVFLWMCAWIRSSSGFGRGQNKNSELKCYTTVSKKQLIEDVYNIAAYLIAHDYLNVLDWRTTRLGVIKQVNLVRRKAKSNAGEYLETIGEYTVQFFIPGSLFSVSQLKSLSFEIYYFKLEPQRKVAIFAFTRAAPLKMTKL